MSFLLDEFGLKMYIDAMVVVPEDTYQLTESRKEMAWAKRLILYIVRSHIVSHIAAKGMAKEMWRLSPRYTKVLLSRGRCTYRRS